MLREKDLYPAGHWTAKGLREAALHAWGIALSDYYYPPLPDVVIEHKVQASSYFYIDTADWTVHLNTAGVPDQLSPDQYSSYFRSVCHHEIQHYLICPYDTVMNGMMFAGAHRHVNDTTAMFVCNLFADLVIDSRLLQRFPTLTRFRVDSNIQGSALVRSHHSPLWILIVTCYKEMWNYELPESLEVDDKTIELSREIVRITKRYMNREPTWPKATTEIAKLIAEWQPETDENQLPGCTTGSPEPSGTTEDDSESILIPLDVDGMMGNPTEVRNGDMARRCIDSREGIDLEAEMERLAIEVEQRGGDLRDLEGVYFVAGIGSKKKEWIRFWYRAKAQGLLQFKIKSKRPSGSTPLSLELWRLGDPIEELDIVQSLQAFPILIPNLSTRKWMKASHYSDEESDALPDLLVVIDSSGSMTWTMSKTKVSGAYHLALVSAFAAVDTALRRGARVAAINFSDSTRECAWTRIKHSVERTLLAYQGGGTVAPVIKIEELCERADSIIMILMITDAEIANWSSLVKSIKRLSRRGQKYFVFHIADERYELSKKTRSQLEKAGAFVVSVGSVDSLPGLVIKEVKSIYRA